jgi:hypothetical protein
VLRVQIVTRTLVPFYIGFGMKSVPRVNELSFQFGFSSHQRFCISFAAVTMVSRKSP